ncbi:hypothetical protein COCON_G00070950 [Conger conger]|uniref:Uncharacterized protein n=1 Tax=Conger conger TaxID=82655 RepID=A0A9Q1DTJ0_CONCO|nr:hypothetical protein COCON_G00070950 [Conger conger]
MTFSKCARRCNRRTIKKDLYKAASEFSALWTTAMVKPEDCVVSLLNDVAQKSFGSLLRSVSIHLTNNCKSHVLMNPQVYTSSGHSYDPPQPTVEKGVTQVCAFGHEKGCPLGAVGVLTYDIVDSQKKAIKRLAIMFSVPFNYVSDVNWFALGLFDVAQACGESLYELMYYREGPFKREKASGSEMSFQEGKHTLIGTMCPMGNAEIKVELWD